MVSCFWGKTPEVVIYMLECNYAVTMYLAMLLHGAFLIDPNFHLTSHNEPIVECTGFLQATVGSLMLSFLHAPHPSQLTHSVVKSALSLLNSFYNYYHSPTFSTHWSPPGHHRNMQNKRAHCKPQRALRTSPSTVVEFDRGEPVWENSFFTHLNYNI
jgi:hypothetical protein